MILYATAIEIEHPRTGKKYLVVDRAWDSVTEKAYVFDDTPIHQLGFRLDMDSGIYICKISDV